MGVFTYSRRVMTTVGGSLMTLSPLAALVVVVANALVLFVFSSRQLSAFVVVLGLPPIASGWLTTPVIAALVSFVLLFVVQNVFGQQVYRPVAYQLSPPALAMDREPVEGALRFRGWLRRQVRLNPAQEALVLRIAEIRPVSIDAEGLRALEDTPLSPAYREVMAALQGRSFLHPWQLAEPMARQSPLWSPLPR